MHSATLSLHFDQKHTAEIIYKALAPELSKKIPQTSTIITRTDETLTLSIKAQTSSSLRAAINSYSRWIETALQVQQI
jgi:tRNA threonylcarbamoyladenosine modification (KEOPS) complex  Pcc1 subunit